MAARKPAAPVRPLLQKYRVGQRCAFVFDAAAGWARANGAQCIILAPKQRVSVWCSNLDGSHSNYKRGVQRYCVRWSGGEVWVPERNLRSLYDGDELSTWREFARRTGFDLERTAKGREHSPSDGVSSGRAET